MAAKTTTRAPAGKTGERTSKSSTTRKPAEPTKAGADARKRAAKPSAAKPRAKPVKPAEKRVETTTPAVPASSASARAKSKPARLRQSRAKKPVVEKIEPVARVVEDVVPVPPVSQAVEPAVSVSAPARVVEAREPARDAGETVHEPAARPPKRRHLTLVQPALGAGERESAGVARTESGVGARVLGGAEFDGSSVDLAVLLGGSKTEGGAQAATTRVSGIRTAAPVASAQVAAPVVLPVESEARRDAYENVLKRLDESEAYERNSTPSLLRTRVFAGISLAGAGLVVAAFTPWINGIWAVLSVVGGAIAFYNAGTNFLELHGDRKRLLSNRAPSSVSYAAVRKAFEVARVNGLPLEVQTENSKIDIFFGVLRKLVEEHKPKDVREFIASNEGVVVEALRLRIEEVKGYYLQQKLLPDCEDSIRRSLQELIHNRSVRFLERSHDYLDFLVGELVAHANPGASYAGAGSEAKLELLNKVQAYIENRENKRELAELMVRTAKAFCEREITAVEAKLQGKVRSVTIEE